MRRWIDQSQGYKFDATVTATSDWALVNDAEPFAIAHAQPAYERLK